MGKLSIMDIKQCALQRFGTLRSGALFMKNGNGKIRTAFDIIRQYRAGFDFIVWIAPASALRLSVYKKMVKYHAGDLVKKIYFYSIDAVSFSTSRFLHLYDLTDKYRTFCVVDESLTIKNTEAGRTRRLLSIRNKFKYRLILNGIPLTQGLIDLYSQVEFMSGSLLKMSESQFSYNFLPFGEDSQSFRRRWSTPEKEVTLVEMMKPFIFECDLHLNYKINYYDRYFKLTRKEADSYMLEKEQFLKDNYPVAFLEVVQKFQRIYTISEAKVKAFFRLIKEIKKRGERVIVYIKFIDEIELLRGCGVLEGFRYVEYTGKSNKKLAVEQFEAGGDVDIMFCTYKVACMGLGLSYCNNIIFFSQTFDYRDKVRCLYDFHQIEQNKDVNIYNFWVNTGLEKLMKNNLCRKKNVLRNVCESMGEKEMVML